ncbi:MAG: RNA recognition motif domain-containing protein [Thermoplasmatota archaeon]
MNIYVGNISYNASEADIQSAFEAFGQVDSVTIIKDRFTGRSKGFGFVEMPNDDEAKKAIAEMDGKELVGRDLKVNEARPRNRF